MRTIQKEIYTFAELSEHAKENARNWYREGFEFEEDYMFESFETAGKLLGITFASRSIPLMNGKTREEPNILYSGFSCQGDGLSFTGSFTFAKGCSKAIRKEFPKDETLHRIADELTTFQSRTVLMCGRTDAVEANITKSSMYATEVHKGTMDLTVINRDEDENVTELTDCEELLELMRDFAQWMYDSLEQEYDYQTSDESIDESIEINDYEFDEHGRITG